MPDPVASQLPPEWMEAIELALRRQTKSWPAGTLRTIERALAPLLAEREAETNAARDRAVASRNRLDDELAASQAEARRLREVLEEIAARRISKQTGSMVPAHDEWRANEIARAALASSPVTEPEQEEAPWITDQSQLTPRSPSSSSEEGERADLTAQDHASLAAICDHYLYATRWVEAADPKPHEVHGIDLLKERRELARRLEREQYASISAPSLRERLTDDGLVEVLARAAYARGLTEFEFDWEATAEQWRTDARADLAAVVDYLEEGH